MTTQPDHSFDKHMSRRAAISTALAAAKPDARRASPKRYDMKKSIHLWAFPCPERMLHPYPHYPEALIYQTADSMDRLLGLKAA